MDAIRGMFDYWYGVVKPAIFRLTQGDPQKAHEVAVKFLGFLHDSGLEEIVLDNKANELHPPFELSNAGGYNKDGAIPPSSLRLLGFDRVVVGTVTGYPWPGNPRPTIIRYPETESLVNWQGLPGKGAREVAKTLRSYGEHGVPLTINLMSTPQKKGDAILSDLKRTVLYSKDIPEVDRYELNISCPNTHGWKGCMGARREYQEMLVEMIYVVDCFKKNEQELYVKLSPDLDSVGLKDIMDTADDYAVDGFTIANTTTQHGESYIPRSPGKGGASGKAVYGRSRKVQKMFKEMSRAYKSYKSNWKLIACGGLDSRDKVLWALKNGASGIQLYTPLIFKGPGFVKRLRKRAEFLYR